MSEKDVARVSVRILDRDYFVACSPEERSDLLDAAEHLSDRMREIRDSGRIVGVDRIAVMAALNLANEVLKLRQRDRRTDSELTPRVRALRERVESALSRNQQLDL